MFCFLLMIVVDWSSLLTYVAFAIVSIDLSVQGA